MEQNYETVGKLSRTCFDFVEEGSQSEFSEDELYDDERSDESPEEELDEKAPRDLNIPINKLLPRTFSFDQNYFVMTKIRMQ